MTDLEQTVQDADKKDVAICSTYVGEHTEEVAKHMAKWMTEHLKKGTNPEEFDKIWSAFEESDGEPSDKVPGITQSEDEEIYWFDVLQLEEDLPNDLYRKAVNGKADRFITFNNNAYMDIVAIRGRPSPRNIALCVLKEEENVDPWTKRDTIACIGEDYLKGTE